MRTMPYSALSSDGTAVYIHRWEPDGPSKAQLLLVHGYAEHAARYLPLVKALTGGGIRVVAPDHVGHGRSEGLRGYVPRIETLVDDVSRLLGAMYAAEPELPLFVFGHSMGGAVAIMAAATHPSWVHALVLSGPALHIANTAKPLQWLAPLPAALLPKVPFLPLKSSDVSRDPEAGERYKSDPLNYVGKVRFGTGWQLIRAGRMALEAAGSLAMPVWLGHGTDDGLAGVSGSEALTRRLRSGDVTFRKVQGARHEILNEPEGERLVDEICRWLKDRID